ncbi:MAG: hypothetical protein KTU85_04160 [Acidimicrobiia bacterium]|nr:hypothetical protein [Acidimicrobiia bacterium]MCY4458154.1 protein DpdD [Acidimicrobiaceae bacterium]
MSDLIVSTSNFNEVIRVLGPYGERTQAVVDRQSQLWDTATFRWAVIPFVDGAGVRWDFVAVDNESERRGREIVLAFFGPFASVPNDGGQDSPTGGAYYHQVPLAVSGGLGRFVETLELMVSVRSDEPDLRREISDPISLLLRDFYLALDRTDSVTSNEILSRIEATGQFSSENLRFLQVERLGRLGYWQELSGLPWFADLARTRRPRRISEHMLESVWRANFDEAAVGADPNVAFEGFVELGLEETYGRLLQSVDIPQTVSGRRLVCVSAHIAGNSARVKRLLASASDGELPVLRLLGTVSMDGAAQVDDGLSVEERAREHLGRGEFVEVVALAEIQSDPNLASLAVHAAYELNDPNSCSLAMEAVGRVSSSSLPKTRQFQTILGEVERLATNRCNGWSDWLSRIAADELWVGASDVARECSPQWDINELLVEVAADTAANALHTAGEGINRRELRAVLDLLCGLVGKIVDRPVADPIVDAILLVLALDENPSAPVRDAFFRLATDVLHSGPTVSRYKDLVAIAQDLWQRVGARETVVWALDLADALAVAPSPDPGVLREFMVAVGNKIMPFASRLALDERRSIETLATECGTNVVLPPLDTVPEASQNDIWNQLTGSSVGLYSLLEGAGGRFEKRLRDLCRDVEVMHNADKVATHALQTMAKRVNFLIVDTRHASHAATATVDAVRPRSLQLFPNGGGISSFIAILREALIDTGA